VTNIEEVVRHALHDQVSHQPAMIEPARRALAGATAVRRRRSVLAVGAVVVALLGVAAGVGTLRNQGGGPVLPPATTGPTLSTAPSPTTAPSTAPSVPTVGLSALIDNGQQLLVPDGKLVSLSQLGGVAMSGYQTSDGWLVNVPPAGPTDSGSLWLVQANGTVQRLIDHADSIVVAPDGRRFAWHSGGNLVVGHLGSTGAVVTDATTAAPQRGGPLAFTGSAVLLGYSATGGGLDHLDVWVPQHGQYTPHWNQTVGIVGVFGATPDGWLIGQALTAPGTGSKNSCLARLDPMNALRVVATACGLPAAFESGSVSPDGHWLAYLSQSGGSTQTVLVDLRTVFQQPKTAGTWQTATLGAWTDPDTMVVQGQDLQMYRYQAGQSAGEQIAVNGMPPGSQPVLMPKLS
jgi:hypothetical protein